MKIFMPNLSEKYVTSRTLQRSPHQHLRCSTSGGNIASFIRLGLSSYSGLENVQRSGLTSPTGFYSHGLLDGDEATGYLLVVSRDVAIQLVIRFSVGWFWIADAIPGAALTHMLRPFLELGNLGGDPAALATSPDLVQVPAKLGPQVVALAVRVEALGEVVDAVLDVEGDVADLLRPVRRLLVGAAVAAEAVEEGLHAGQLVADELDVAADAADQGVLLR